MEYVFRSIYPKLNTQSRFLKKICCRILSSGDSFWAICGYISLIINSSECYSRTKQFILFVATRRILILFNCHTSDNFFVDNARSPDEPRSAVGHIVPLLFWKYVASLSCWKFAFVSFSKASETNLAPAKSESSRGPYISYLDFLINVDRSLFPQ